MECKKLTFYLHVHFAVLPLRKLNEKGTKNVEEKQEKECNQVEVLHLETKSEMQTEKENESQNNEGGTYGMEVLRNFLETKGTEFSAEPEFLSYYALPFVTEPGTHPSFQELFTDSWVKRLSTTLQDFVIEHSWGPTVAPRLLQMGLESQCNLIPKSYSQLLETHKHFKHLKSRYQKLHKDHHKLIGIAAELTEALESSVKGQAVDLKSTLHNCSKIFPDLFHQSTGIESQSEVPPEEIIRQTLEQTREDHTSSGFDLDFRKIKHHLTSGSIKTKLLLFQALRWRITQSSSEERDNVVGSYFRHDVLNLHRSSSLLPLSEHFNPPYAATPHPLQQVAARLVNTLASLRCGRDYLSSAGCGLLRVLVSCLRGDKGVKVDSITSDMILATLQKLSLRHSQRVAMIEIGLVEWLIQRLSADAITMKPYTLEYSTALLMNLCLHRRAKERCIPLAKTVLKLLTALLGTETTQAIPYVNGTLYSLLAHPQLNHEARRMGLCGVLEYYLKHCEGEMSKQLEYILKLHRGDCQPDHSATSDEENADDDAVS
ncbi:LisH domain-containing protein ARMC9 [Blattella germanica]|nr:LisH domain-containing protein ARMC9 [Blattella germanica]